MKFSTGWVITVCFFAALIGVFAFFVEKSVGGPRDASFPATMASTSTVQVASTLNVPEGYKEYRNKHYGFSVYYPAEIPPQELPDRDDQLTVLFQGAAGEPGFEIYVAPTKDTTITPERFKLDQPSSVMKERHDTSIDGVSAITFFGFNAGVGETREVWFIHNGFLFEVTTYKKLDSWLSDIMQTWQVI
jgi:hypothetical protein